MKKIIRFLFLKSCRANINIKTYLKLKDNKNLFSRILTNLLYEKIYIDYSMIIGRNSIVGINISFPHLQNIVIGDGVVIGNNCFIYQDVTLGQNRGKYPVIGDNVIIYAGAKIFGNVSVGNNAIIGANAVVTKNVPDNAIVGGNPASHREHSAFREPQNRENQGTHGKREAAF